jgi:hypothetical protein
MTAEEGRPKWDLRAASKPATATTHYTPHQYTDLGARAVEYARHHWAVFPLAGKVPAIKGGRGVLDATTNVDQVALWWTIMPSANIGGRVPDSMFVIDVDPRHGGLDTIDRLERQHGALPVTLTTLSGRGDLGCHLFFRRPPGRLLGRNLGPGIDLKTSSGYVVLPPSIHPDTGGAYQRIEAEVAAPPYWLIDLLRQPPIRPTSIHQRLEPRRRYLGKNGSVAARFGETTDWSDILCPHGWEFLGGNSEDDGGRWRHPDATSPSSATTRYGCLFVYSTNTPFDVTSPQDPNGYTKFRAYAVLNHDGDLSAAARALLAKEKGR